MQYGKMNAEFSTDLSGKSTDHSEESGMCRINKLNYKNVKNVSNVPAKGTEE